MRLTYQRVITAGAALLFVAALGFVTRGSIRQQQPVLSAGQGGSQALAAPSQPAAGAAVGSSSSTRVRQPLQAVQLKKVNIGLRSRGGDDGTERSDDGQRSEGGDDGG